jgi:integrase
VTIITTCFNWAKKKQLISKNPIAGGVVDRPPPVHRNKDSLITADEHRRMVDASEYRPRYYPSKGGYCLWAKGACAMLAKGPQADPAVLALAIARMDGVKKELGVIEPFAFLLRVLSHTGARPGELLNATASDWNPRLGAFVHEAKDEPEKERGFTHKTARKGKDRFVFVSDPELRDAIEELRLEYPEGPIFRNLYRRPWSASAVCARFDALKKKLGLNPHITCYSYRHTSITNMMLKGLSWGLIAETHGTSIEMLSKYYGHLDGHAGAMADFWAMAKATPAPGSGGSAGDTPGVSESR